MLKTIVLLEIEKITAFIWIYLYEIYMNLFVTV